jgi:CheY-like chemotaxis protein
MVKTLIEQNGGEVTMTTAQGLGTTFTLSLPEAEHPPLRHMARVPPLPTEMPYRKGLRILIADDEREVRSTLLCSLIAHGLQATAVPDSYSLIKEISRTPLTYDLVIVDDGMPGSSAIELCETIHAIVPNTPVIVTSGDATLATQLPYDNARCFLAKPFTVGDLTATIESVLGTIE